MWHGHHHPRPDFQMQELLSALQHTQMELSLAYRQFNLVTDPELIESCIYQISALKARYNYLIRTMKAAHPEGVAAGSPEGRALWM
ncbi:MAG: YaaL family protein [Oscillospiraceae bacterium]